MGWLKDLMDEAPNDLRSFDELARACLKSDRWPASATMGHRSLGAILGRLDRGEGAEWLGGRPEVQQALSGVLGIQRGTLLVALNPRRTGRAERWVTWQAMPLARGLDLVEETLFPGIPDVIQHPARWERLVWVAPNGAGRTLAGQWLAARGLAAHRVQPSIDGEGLPPMRPLLVELGSARGLAERHLGPGLCVAVPEPWEPPAGFGDCAVVRTPPIRELVPALVRWASARLTQSTDVEPDALAERLLSLADRGLLESAGDVLGLVGLADAEGMGALEAKSLERLARDWLRRRAREKLDPEAPEAGWVRQSGFETLVSVAQHVVTEGTESLFAPRSIEAWSSLVPAELRAGPDLEWMKIALPRADPSLRPAALERASEKLPPGAFRLLRSLEHTGVLAREDDDSLALRPHWLGRVLVHEALSRLVSGPAFDWGEALLGPATAPPTIERLVEKARTRALVGDELVEPEASADPAYAAAIEGAVRALGAAELAGIHAGGDALEALWDEQLRLSVELPEQLVGPRVEHAAPSGRRGAFWLSRGAWYLGLLAASEALDDHQGRRHALLRPWQETEPHVRLPELLDHVASALERSDAPSELVGPALALVTRLGALLGPLGRERARHRLERAATMADEAAVGVLSWSSVAALEGDRLAVLGLMHLVDHRRFPQSALAAQVWQAFDAAGRPEAEAGVLLVPELARAVFPHAPEGALPKLARALGAAAEPPLLSATQWAGVLAGDVAEVPLGVFRHLPEAAVAAGLAAALRGGRRDALELLWARFPAVLSSHAVNALLEPETSGDQSLLLDAAPPGAAASVLGGLKGPGALLARSAASIQATRRFLHASVAARAPGFREAYALLDDIEHQLERVRPRA